MAKKGELRRRQGPAVIEEQLAYVSGEAAQIGPCGIGQRFERIAQKSKEPLVDIDGQWPNRRPPRAASKWAID